MGESTGRRLLRIGILDNDLCAGTFIAGLARQACNGAADVWTTTQPAKALQICTQIGHPTHVLLLDMALNGVTGIQVAEELRQRGCAVGIIAMTSYEPSSYHADCVRVGIQALLDKSRMQMNLRDAIEAVANGDHYPASSDFPTLGEVSLSQTIELTPALTRTEQLIVSMSLGHQDVEQIAERLSIAADTVYSHRRNINRKLRTRSWYESLDRCRQLHIA